MARLDAGMEKPYERQFKGNPLARIMADRGRYIAAALTIVRAYRAAGQPGRQPVLASFGEWSDTLRSALVWLERADPYDTMERARADDPELGRARAIFAAWEKELLPTGSYKGVEIIHVVTEQAEQHLLLREAGLDVASRRGVPDARALGTWLGRWKDKVVDGLRLTIEGESGGVARVLLRLLWRATAPPSRRACRGRPRPPPRRSRRAYRRERRPAPV